MNDFPIPWADVRVEFRPTNPPKPTCLGIFDGKRLVALVSYEDAKLMVERYEALQSAWAAAHPRIEPPGG